MPGGLLLVLGERLKSYLELLGRYAAVQTVLALALLALIVLAAGFGVTALTIWLAGLWGPAPAFAAVGAGFLVVALLLEVVIVVRRRGRNKHAPSFKAKADMPPEQAAFGSVAAMAVIGYLIGRQLMRR